MLCGMTSNLERHHIIPGRGKRKACETEESVIDLCYGCHVHVHSSKGNEDLMRLKRYLQKKYFEQGLSEEDVRVKMGDRLYLNEEGEIHGLRNGLNSGEEVSAAKSD